jgi:hypothetical protein
MGKKKDKAPEKQQKKREKRLKELAQTQCPPQGCKKNCCKKYKKCESKRCKKCPCHDLLKQLRSTSPGLQRVA